MSLHLTRREFAAAGAVVSLTVLGCGERNGSSRRAAGSPPPEPFFAGPLEQYRNPGVYDRFVTDDADDPANKGVWLVSDGKRLVAILARCTHLGCTTEWDAELQRFVCPCHGSQFDVQGVNEPGAKAKRPLERCTVSLAEAPDGEQVRVDPTTRHRRANSGWDEPGASITF